MIRESDYNELSDGELIDEYNRLAQYGPVERLDAVMLQMCNRFIANNRDEE